MIGLGIILRLLSPQPRLRQGENRRSRDSLKFSFGLLFLSILYFLNVFWIPAFAGMTEEKMKTKREAPLRIVGSSAVFPFAATVAEYFHHKTHLPIPLIEATGTGAGIKLFCSSLKKVDGVMTSRPFTTGEKEKCVKQGIIFEEFKIGQDGLVLIQNEKEKPLSLTLADLGKALVNQVSKGATCIFNPYHSWQDVNPTLPSYSIHVLGPASTSGTYDVLMERIKGPCGVLLRQDGAYVEAPANENLIVQKIIAASHTIGIVTFSFYDQNKGRLKALPIEEILPSFASIQEGSYPLSRSLYLYIKMNQMSAARAAFVREFTSLEANGENGYLGEKGLIPLSAKEQKEIRNRVEWLRESL